MSHLTLGQAKAVEYVIRQLEEDPSVSKREFRLFMQVPMACGHTPGDLLTCDDPPYGCSACGVYYNEDGSPWKDPSKKGKK